MSSITEIPVREWSTLRDMYLVNWPKDYITYFTIDHALKHWKENGGVSIYSLENDYEDGTFLYVSKKSSVVHFNTLTENIEKLKAISNILGNMRLQFVISMSKKFEPLIKYMETLANVKYEYEDNSLFYIDKEKALDLKIPEVEDIFLRLLVEDDGDTVNELWPHKFTGSVHFVKNLIRTDYSMGAFSKTSGDLLAWILRYPTGSFAMLQVRESHYRNGLGRLVTTAMTKKLAENGLDSSATILMNNIASRNLFMSVGYEEAYEMFIYRTID
ncbi:GLYATL3 family protein [Megaselia abdita]